MSACHASVAAKEHRRKHKGHEDRPAKSCSRWEGLLSEIWNPVDQASKPAGGIPEILQSVVQVRVCCEMSERLKTVDQFAGRAVVFRKR